MCVFSVLHREDAGTVPGQPGAFSLSLLINKGQEQHGNPDKEIWCFFSLLARVLLTQEALGSQKAGYDGPTECR